MTNSAMPVFERGQFHKATRSGQNPQACVEVARERGWVEIRDSKQPWNSQEDHRLVFTAEQFDTWLAAMHAATTDLPSTDTLAIEIVRHGDGVNVFRSTAPLQRDNVLTFTDDEIEAFLDGVRNGEFTALALT
jgi:uncharacterized protein DUF397